MKKLRAYFYIILFVPLLAGFSQASLGVGTDCVQCITSQKTQPSCCKNNAAAEVSDECFGQPAFSKIPCPHNELCQSRDTPPAAVVVNATFSQNMGYAVSSFSLVEQTVFSTTVKDAKVRPPPLPINRVRYILLCSFLI